MDWMEYDYVLWYAILAMNIITLLVYGFDKTCAKLDKWRVPEFTLLALTAVFGGLGAFLAMWIFRHKTKHWKFKVLVPVFLIVQLAIVIYAVAEMYVLPL